MDGTDWAYSKLVGLATKCGPTMTRGMASLFRKEVLSNCVGMACADIDHARLKNKPTQHYETVRDVCSELSK